MVAGIMIKTASQHNRYIKKGYSGWIPPPAMPEINGEAPSLSLRRAWGGPFSSQ